MRLRVLVVQLSCALTSLGLPDDDASVASAVDVTVALKSLSDELLHYLGLNQAQAGRKVAAARRDQHLKELDQEPQPSPISRGGSAASSSSSSASASPSPSPSRRPAVLSWDDMCSMVDVLRTNFNQSLRLQLHAFFNAQLKLANKEFRREQALELIRDRIYKYSTRLLKWISSTPNKSRNDDAWLEQLIQTDGEVRASIRRRMHDEVRRVLATLTQSAAGGPASGPISTLPTMVSNLKKSFSHAIGGKPNANSRKKIVAEIELVHRLVVDMYDTRQQLTEDAVNDNGDVDANGQAVAVMGAAMPPAATAVPAVSQARPSSSSASNSHPSIHKQSRPAVEALRGCCPPKFNSAAELVEAWHHKHSHREASRFPDDSSVQHHTTIAAHQLALNLHHWTACHTATDTHWTMLVVLVSMRCFRCST